MVPFGGNHNRNLGHSHGARSPLFIGYLQLLLLVVVQERFLDSLYLGGNDRLELALGHAIPEEEDMMRPECACLVTPLMNEAWKQRP